ncbi:MAG: EAL domain-containing response regulator [Rhodobacteraceae bacterium]|nr:EAL domain-containing response regulator [Paracoccaceae bacterium]
MTDSEIRALIVDDKAFMRTMAGRILYSAGVTDVLYAENGAQALDIIKSADPPVSVVFSDIAMPDMDGIQLARHLAKLESRPCIAFVSGSNPAVLATTAAMAKARGLTVLGTIEKPVSLDAVKQALASFISTTGKIATSGTHSIDLNRNDIANAARSGEFILYYQPKTNLNTNSLAGFESLIRWNHPVHGIVQPGAFISFAERENLIGDLTAIVVARALDQLSAWNKSHFSTRISVNLSAKMLADLTLPDRLEIECNRRGILPHQLILEITESGLFENEADGLEILGRLHLKGFPLSIDDFGTGYSSMDQLRRVPFGELKIDRAFVNGAAQNARARAILESAAQLAHKLGLSVVAEGAETEEDCDLLRKTGIQYVQGFYIARPMPVTDVSEWVKTWNSRHSGKFH